MYKLTASLEVAISDELNVSDNYLQIRFARPMRESFREVFSRCSWSDYAAGKMLRKPASHFHPLSVTVTFLTFF